jgi:hypothetical protein
VTTRDVLLPDIRDVPLADVKPADVRAAIGRILPDGEQVPVASFSSAI